MHWQVKKKSDNATTKVLAIHARYESVPECISTTIKDAWEKSCIVYDSPIGMEIVLLLWFINQILTGMFINFTAHNTVKLISKRFQIITNLECTLLHGFLVWWLSSWNLGLVPFLSITSWKFRNIVSCLAENSTSNDNKKNARILKGDKSSKTWYSILHVHIAESRCSKHVWKELQSYTTSQPWIHKRVKTLQIVNLS